MIKIRDAVKDDMDIILELANEMHQESRLNVLELNFEKIETLFLWLIDSDDGFLKVVEKDGRIIGGFAGFVMAHWTSDDLAAHDAGLFITPQHRGSGAGALLIKDFKQWAEQKGAKMITVAINTGVLVEETRGLFEHCGFKSVGYVLEGKK